MSNPAADLATLLRSWEEVANTTTVYAARAPGETPRRGIELWRRVARAVDLIEQIERLLDAREASGRDVRNYRSLIPELYERVFAPDLAWGTSGSGMQARLTVEQERALGMMADVLEGDSGATGVRLTTIKLKLAQAHDLLTSLGRTDVASLHLQWQIEQAMRLLEDMGRHDPSYVAEVLDETLRQAGDFDATLREDDTVSDETRSTFRSIFRDVAVNVTSTAIWQGAIAAAPEVLKALGA